MRRRFTSNRKTSSLGYCAITATQDNTNIICSPFDYIYYSINDTSNWSRCSTLIITTLNTGDTVYLKSTGAGSPNISCSKAVELSGSILSLVYGDNNSNETSLSHIKSPIATFSNVVSVSSNFLPSKDLGKACYSGMFIGCTDLIKAPELPATTLVDSCYTHMFDCCTNLNYIKMLATDISAVGCLDSWVSGVASTGTFVKSKDATWDVVGANGVPTGWTVITDEQESGGGDSGSGLEFPLYLEFDSCEALDKWTTACVRNSDETSIKLRDYFVQVAIEYASNNNGIYTVTEQELDLLGVEVYIDSQKVSYYTYDGEKILLYMQSVYETILFREDCTLYWEGML